MRLCCAHTHTHLWAQQQHAEVFFSWEKGHVEDVQGVFLTGFQRNTSGFTQEVPLSSICAQQQQKLGGKNEKPSTDLLDLFISFSTLLRGKHEKKKEPGLHGEHG